jgi:LysM repeat protein/ABC-type branched-subunit amino acid transport system substrate-binding protein
MRRLLLISSVLICLASFTSIDVLAQEYVATPVTRSKEKVKSNGKLYYSHVVLEKQTLFSIAKTYGVTIQEIYDANPSMDIEQQGLKKDEIILIPYKSISVKNLSEENPGSRAQPTQSDYFYHVVKWFEDLDDIAKKYDIPVETIMKFNGMTDKSVSRKQKIKIPIHPELINQAPAPQQGNTPLDNKIQEKINNIKEGKTEQEVVSRSEMTVNATLLLPFNTTSRVNDNSLDFYSGALIAIRDLGNAGIGTDLHVYDASLAPLPVTEERFGLSDIVIGPSSPADISKALAVCPSGTSIVSPLDPRSASLAYSHQNVIQAPTPANVQYRDLIKWIGDDRRLGDKIILVTEKGAKPTSGTNEIITALEKSGLTYNIVSYTILESKNILSTFSAIMSSTGSNRVLAASESEAFVNDLVRNLDLMVHKGMNVVLYSPSKIRTFDTIDVESFHHLSLHVSAGYYIDYNDPRVQRFVLDYRSLFGCDPSQFAFQGYDIAYFFIGQRARYGKSWEKNLDHRVNMLQGDFKFESAGNGGYINDAVRRVVYNPDFSISLIGR